MPFVGLARVHSQEQAALGLSTRPAPTAPAAIPLTPVVSSHSSRTADVEAQAEELKEGKEVSGKEPTGGDAFEVAFTNGREGLHPHTWSPRYRWCLTAFAGLLVLNSSMSDCLRSYRSRADDLLDASLLIFRPFQPHSGHYRPLQHVPRE